MSSVLLSLQLPITVLPVEQPSSRLKLALPYCECVRLDCIYVDPVVGQELVGAVEVEVVVLHQQFLDVSEAVRQRRLRVQVQYEQALARRDHLVRVYHWCSLYAFVQRALRPPPGPLLVLLDEGYVAPVLELEELGVLVGVEYLALLGPVDLLLEHPVVAVGYGLLQDGVLLRVVVDRRPPELLHEAFIAHLLDYARVLHGLYFWAIIQLLQEVAVAQVVFLVEEEVEGASIHYIKAHVLDGIRRLVCLPRVELVEHRDGPDPHEGTRVSLGDVDLRQTALGDCRRLCLVVWARAHETV